MVSGKFAKHGQSGAIQRIACIEVYQYQLEQAS